MEELYQSEKTARSLELLLVELEGCSDESNHFNLSLTSLLGGSNFNFFGVTLECFLAYFQSSSSVYKDETFVDWFVVSEKCRQ